MVARTFKHIVNERMRQVSGANLENRCKEICADHLNLLVGPDTSFHCEQFRDKRIFTQMTEHFVFANVPYEFRGKASVELNQKVAKNTLPSSLVLGSSEIR